MRVILAKGNNVFPFGLESSTTCSYSALFWGMVETCFISWFILKVVLRKSPWGSLPAIAVNIVGRIFLIMLKIEVKNQVYSKKKTKHGFTSYSNLLCSSFTWTQPWWLSSCVTQQNLLGQKNSSEKKSVSFRSDQLSCLDNRDSYEKACKAEKNKKTVRWTNSPSIRLQKVRWTNTPSTHLQKSSFSFFKV